MQQSRTVEIDRPVSAVFAYAEDEKNAPKWAEGIVRFDITQREPGMVGSRFRLVIKEGGKDTPYDGEVVAWEKDRRSKSHVTPEKGARFSMTMERLYEARDGRTRLTMTVWVDMRGPAKLLTPMMWLMNRHFLRKQGAKLKELVEAQPTMAPPMSMP